MQRATCLSQDAELRVKEQRVFRLPGREGGTESYLESRRSAAQAIAVPTRIPAVIVLRHLSGLDTRGAWMGVTNSFL